MVTIDSRPRAKAFSPRSVHATRDLLLFCPRARAGDTILFIPRRSAASLGSPRASIGRCASRHLRKRSTADFSQPGFSAVTHRDSGFIAVFARFALGGLAYQESIRQGTGRWTMTRNADSRVIGWRGREGQGSRSCEQVRGRMRRFSGLLDCPISARSSSRYRRGLAAHLLAIG